MYFHSHFYTHKSVFRLGISLYRMEDCYIEETSGKGICYALTFNFAIWNLQLSITKAYK